MRVPRFLGSADFWRGAVIATLALLVTWLYLQNRSLLHTARVESCRATQELQRKIYVTAADLDVPLKDRLKFLPSEDCDSLP